MVILYLTCADTKEADKIGQELLNKKLVVCVRQINVRSSYWWEDKISNDDEVLLMMESGEELFEKINKVVAKLHSYEQYVLTMTKVDKTTRGVEEWLDKYLGSRPVG
jgi:periplasmic divalent cation tolerance protein